MGRVAKTEFYTVAGVFDFVFYQLELCGEKLNRNLNNFFFDVAHNFFSVLADIRPQCSIFVWLIAYKRNRHFSSSTQLATSLGQDLHQERSPRSPYSEHGSDISILFHSGMGLTGCRTVRHSGVYKNR
jgi:hypothetical protein